tara:strand:- start:158 stop:559 length:402 start_codon:yes stop_codon:yes gene_type:complete
VVLEFEGSISSNVGEFYINENNVILGVVVRKDENSFSVCISGETQVKLPFTLSTTNTQPFFLDKTTGLISLFTSTEQGDNEKVIGFLYGCEVDVVQETETQTVNNQQIEVVVSETSTIVEKQINELHTAFVEI